MSPKKLVILACLLLLVVGVPVTYFVNQMRQNPVIGMVDGRKIYQKDLSTQERQALFEATNQLYGATENVLAKRYFQSIIDNYKKENKIADDAAAQQSYVSSHVKVSEEDIKAFIDQNAENPQLKGKSFEEQKQLVEPYLMQQAAQTFFEKMIQQAEADGKLRVLSLKKPQISKIDIKIKSSDPTKGPANAPVTIIEFADFQCPYCNKAQPTVEALLKKYGDKVRFVFKDFPLVGIHEQAIGAAIAAKCAQEQGKYWEMHDKLFENYRNLSEPLYTTLAQQLTLDVAQFQACQQNPLIRAQLMEDMKYAESLGITATPAFYVNGTLLMGAQPMSAFERVIDDELAKH